MTMAAMKQMMYFLMVATVLMTASCNSKEKEENVYNRIVKSTNMNELRAYVSDYSDDAPVDHMAKIRGRLRNLVADSTAYANIVKETNLDVKLELEADYLGKFGHGLHIDEVDSLYEVDAKKERSQRLAREAKQGYEMISLQFHNTVFSKSDNRMYGYVFSEADSEGKGKGAYINEYSGEVEKFRYQIAPFGNELEIRPNNGGESRTVTVGNGAIWVDGDGFRALYGEDKYNGVKKFM